MVLVFPVEIFSYRLTECTFQFVEGTALNRTSNGRAVSAVDHYNPWIRASFRTAPLSPRERRGWSAWKNSQRGGMKSFLAYDMSRSGAMAYPNGVPEILDASWNGRGIVTSLAARNMTASGIPVGYIASVGDHIGFVQDSHFTLHEITEGGVADGSGQLTVSFDPFIEMNMFSIGAVAVLYRPKARFVLDPESWEETGAGLRPPISFVGLQVF